MSDLMKALSNLNRSLPVLSKIQIHKESPNKSLSDKSARCCSRKRFFGKISHSHPIPQRWGGGELKLISFEYKLYMIWAGKPRVIPAPLSSPGQSGPPSQTGWGAGGGLRNPVISVITIPPCVSYRFSLHLHWFSLYFHWFSLLFIAFTFSEWHRRSQGVQKVVIWHYKMINSGSFFGRRGRVFENQPKV